MTVVEGSAERAAPLPSLGEPAGVDLSIVVLVVALAASQVLEIGVGLWSSPLSIDEIVLSFALVAALFRHLDAALPTWLCWFWFLELLAIGLPDPVQTFAPMLSTTVLFLCSVLIVDAFRRSPERVTTWFALAWCALASLSSLIALLQWVDIIPRVSFAGVSFQSKSRPTGLQEDANFAAYTFAVSYGFAQVVRQRRLRLIFGALAMAGIVATGSRMGLAILLVLILFGVTWSKSAVIWLRRAAAVTGVVVLALVLLALAAPREFESLYSGARLDDVTTFVQSFDADEIDGLDGYQDDSLTERAVLLNATVEAWADSPVLGTSPEDLRSSIAERTGVSKAAHNGFLERLAIGGVFGLASLLFVVRQAVLFRRFGRRGRIARSLTPIPRSLLIAGGLASIALNVSWWPALLFVGANNELVLRMSRSTVGPRKVGR